MAFKVTLICCGHDDGVIYRDTWTEADQFRNAYRDSFPPHERQGIVSVAD